MRCVRAVACECKRQLLMVSIAIALLCTPAVVAGGECVLYMHVPSLSAAVHVRYV